MPGKASRTGSLLITYIRHQIPNPSMQRMLPYIGTILIFFMVTGGCTVLQEWSNPATILTKTHWKLVSYQNAQGDLVPVNPGTVITLEISDFGTLKGYAGTCTRYSGSYTTMGEVITISNFSRSADPSCNKSALTSAEEEQYFALLPNVTRFNEENNELVLSYYDVRKMLIFSPE
jgi:heat shock protein HslJ